MAQPLETPETVSVASGATDVFATVWTFEREADVQLSVEIDGVATLQEQGVDYVVQAGDWLNDGADLVFQAGKRPPAGARVIRARVTAARQSEPLGDLESFRPLLNEKAFDRLTRMVQEERARGGRALVMPVGVSGGHVPWSADMGERFVTIGTDGAPRVVERPEDFDGLNKLNRVGDNLLEDERAPLLDNVGLPAAPALINDLSIQGGVGDFDPVTETGADDSGPYFDAAASGEAPYLKAGNWFLGEGFAHRVFEKIGKKGPGRVFIDWFGKMLEAGSTLPVGRLISRMGADLMGGVLLGGERLGRGVRVAATRISGAVAIPSDWSYQELNIYARLPTGKIQRVSGTSRCNFLGAFNLNVAGDLVEVGDVINIGVGRTYLLTALDATGFNVSELNGAGVSWADNSKDIYRWCYDVCKGRCSVNGTEVNLTDGEEFWFFFYGAGQHRIQINGTWRAISAIPSNEQVQIGVNLGVIADAPFVMKTRSNIASAVRIQSVFGAIEENVMLAVMADGRALLDLQGLADADVARRMSFAIGGAQRFDGNPDREHYKFTHDGMFGSGVDWDVLEAARCRLLAGPGEAVGYTGLGVMFDPGDGNVVVRKVLVSAPSGGFRTLLIPE